MSEEIKDTQPWYKQWMVWMVIAPPLAAVIAGIITINLAIKSDDGLVVDDYYKEGLGINQSLKRDQLAAEKNISATLFVEADVLKLRLANVDDEVIRLQLIHPTQGQRDQSFEMRRFAEGGYQATMETTISGNWNLLLEPLDNSWRINGRLNMLESSSAVLLPNQ